MALFDQLRHAQPLAKKGEHPAAADRSIPATPATAALRHSLTSATASVEGRWRLRLDAVMIAVGALSLSVVCVWATLTDRVSAEAIVVMIVVLLLALVTIGQGMRYQACNLSLQARACESVAKTTLAVEIMMDFLRQFTLKNQATLSHMVESHKVRVIDELRKTVAALARSVSDGRLRLELAQLEEMIAHKIREIPAGVTFPLPRLEYFDQVLRHLQEPERTPACPACGATRARVSDLDGREGISYTCSHCGHEFSVGITVILEKQS